jgi:hypothetical protein
MKRTKDFRDWTFDELVEHNSWHVIQGLLKGEALKSLIYQVCELTARWNKK